MKEKEKEKVLYRDPYWSTNDLRFEVTSTVN